MMNVQFKDVYLHTVYKPINDVDGQHCVVLCGTGDDEPSSGAHNGYLSRKVSFWLFKIFEIQKCHTVSFNDICFYVQTMQRYLCIGKNNIGQITRNKANLDGVHMICCGLHGYHIYLYSGKSRTFLHA